MPHEREDFSDEESVIDERQQPRISRDISTNQFNES